VQVFFDHKGSKEGETLKASAGLFALPRETWRNRIETDSGPLSIENRNPWRSANAQIDWQHPIGKREILSLGGTWTHENTRRRYVFDNVAGNEGLGPDFSGQFDTRIDTAAAYITFQQQLGSWTIMPGGRMELYSRTISSPGLPDASVKRAQAYPSFHLDHPLSKALDLTVSYSRRIDRPSGDQLRPYAMVTGIQSISLGNPALRDQTTDAYEINLHYHRKHIDAGLIVYDRETSGVWSTGYSVNADGINVVRPVNAGHKTDRGAEIDFNTPILTRVKLSTSINLFDSRVPFDPLLGQSSFASFRSTGNATLEWDGADRGKRPGDIAQLQLTYESARRDYQIRYDARASINLSYTHSFTPTLSLTASADGIGARHFRHVLTAPTVQEDFDRRETLPFFRLKLSKTFGGGKPTSSAPAMPLPQPR
jgi:outer membrane receptor for ferrienterochelin and colicin